MSSICRPANADEIPSILAQLDQTFVWSRGRQLSLAKRFPDCWQAGAGRGLYVLQEAGQWQSVLLCKPLRLQAEGACLTGTMLGAVHTRPDQQGRGLSAALQAWIVQELHALGQDFAVLWTAQTGFYQRLGWRLADAGVFGEYQWPRHADGLPEPPSECGVLPPAVCEIEALDLPGWAATLDQLRSIAPAWQSERLVSDYATVPLPAESTRFWLWQAGGRQTYLAAGLTDDTLIVYDFAGDSAGFAPLWQTATAQRPRLWLNLAADAPARHWLLEHHPVCWRPAQQTLWQCLSDRAADLALPLAYIPYLERI